MAKRIKRVYRPVHEWEETHTPMWVKISGDERRKMVAKCSKFMHNTAAFRKAMFRAIVEWPVSCAVNLSAKCQNRQAWLGHAACCIAIGSPEETTREAWWTLSKQKRDLADMAAAEAIAVWEENYIA